MGYRGIRFLYFPESDSRTKACPDRPKDSSDADRKRYQRCVSPGFHFTKRGSCA